MVVKYKYVLFKNQNNLKLTLIVVSGPCEVETGQSSIIVDIEESRGDRMY